MTLTFSIFMDLEKDVIRVTKDMVMMSGNEEKFLKKIISNNSLAKFSDDELMLWIGKFLALSVARSIYDDDGSRKNNVCKFPSGRQLANQNN